MSVTRREFIIGAGTTLAAKGRLAGFPAIVQRRVLKVGVFISEVDAQGVDERVEPYVSQMRVGLGLAASEINALGGVLGRPVEFLYRDDGGTPPTGVAAQALIDEGCEAIVSGFVMAAPQLLTIRMTALETTVPVLHGFWNDGSYCGPVARHFAPTVRQIIPPIRAYLSEDFEARPFTISNWTPSGRRVSEYMYGALGGAHTGDALVTTPVRGSHDGEYRGVMRWAHDMESNIIWNADPRPYAVNAVNEAVGLGVAEGKTFAYLDFSEWQASQASHVCSLCRRTGAVDSHARRLYPLQRVDGPEGSDGAVGRGKRGRSLHRPRRPGDRDRDGAAHPGCRRLSDYDGVRGHCRRRRRAADSRENRSD